ncbi:hypothetical protein KAU45_02495 [bacterium]|nr:hypothetical protein [bacterium]
MKRRKKPKLEHDLQFKKQPSSEYKPLSSYDLNPTWSLKYLQIDNQWCWSGIQRDKLLEVVVKAKEFEKSKWKELLTKGYPAKFIPVRAIRKEAQEILLDELRIQQETIVRFQISGKERIWGLLIEGVFHVIFWDPEHEIYPSELKHT